MLLSDQLAQTFLTLTTSEIQGDHHALGAGPTPYNCGEFLPMLTATEFDPLWHWVGVVTGWKASRESLQAYTGHYRYSKGPCAYRTHYRLSLSPASLGTFPEDYLEPSSMVEFQRPQE